MLTAILYPTREVQVKLCHPQAPSPQKKEARDFVLPPPAVGPDSAPGGLLFNIAPVVSQTQAKKRGSGGISQKGSLQCARYGAVFGEEDKDRQVFVTGTLPGSTDSAMSGLASMSGYCVKMVQTYLCRIAQVSARELKYVWCWEFQERGALHLHACIECPSLQAAQRVKELWRSLWAKILRLVDAKIPQDLFERADGGTWKNSPEVWQTHSEFVKKSVGRYLSKYVGKQDDKKGQWFPSRWWGCSSLLRSLYREYLTSNTISLPFRPIESINIVNVRNLLKSVLGVAVGGFATDNSPYFSSTKAYSFTFLRPEDNLASVLGTITKSLIGVLTMEEQKIPSVTEVKRNRSKEMAFSVCNRMMPRWAMTRVIQLTYWGKDHGKFCDWATTDLGWSDFASAVKYVCSTNVSGKSTSESWEVRCSDAITVAEMSAMVHTHEMYSLPK